MWVCSVLFMASPLVAKAETMSFGMVGSSHYRCMNWRASDGLPSSTVKAIAQGPDGCLWIATARGLVRFDGHAFLPPPEALSMALDFTALLWDRSGQLWFSYWDGSYARLFCWRPQTCTNREATLFAPKDQTDQSPDGLRVVYEDDPLKLVIRDIFEDRENRIWLSTSRGVRRVESDQRGGYKPSPEVNSESAAAAVRQAPDGRLWVAHREGLAMWGKDALQASSQMPRAALTGLAFSGSDGIWALPRSDDRPLEHLIGEQRTAWPWPMSRGSNRQLLITPAGDVWVVNDEQGAMLISGGQGPALNFTRQNVLPSERLLCVAQDTTGSIWLGTADAGICQLRIVAARTFSTATIDAMPDNQVTDLAVDRSGVVWASFAPTGVVQISKAGEVQRMPGLDGTSVTALIPHSKAGVWAALHKDGTFSVRHVTQQGEADQTPAPTTDAKGAVSRLLEDASGGLWAVTSASGTWRLPSGGAAWLNALPHARTRFVAALQQHQDGRIWVSAGGKDMTLVASDAKRLPDAKVLHVVTDKRWLRGLCESVDGTNWASQAGEGLWSQRGTAPPAVITHGQGLPSDLIVQCRTDLVGHLWLQTLPESLYFAPLKELREVAAHERSSLSFRSLTRSDGVQAAPTSIVQATSAVDNQGRLWFTADRSLILVDPEIATRQLDAPMPWIEKVTVDGEDYPTCEHIAGTPLRLAVGTHSFTVHFGGIGLAEPSRVRCSYRLRGVDADWSSSSSKREVSYLCPAPGEYSFEVRATHEGAAWPLIPAVLTLQVQPALYQRTWFQWVASAAAIGLIIASLHYRRLSKDMRSLAHEQQLYDERSRIARDLHDHLGASISSLRISVAASRQHLLQPAELTAHLAGIEAQMQASALQVDETIWLTNPNNDTLDAFCSYVVEYAQEFCTHTNTECVCELPGELPDRTLAGHVRHHLLSILKEALANSVQHGKATRIELLLAVTTKRLTMIITDNGKPKDPFQPKSQLGGNGLKNMRARAEELGGTFEIGPQENDGICVKVVVPI